MANYGTIQGLQDILLEYTKYTTAVAPAVVTIPTAQMTRYLERATREIDAKLGSIPGIILPLSPVPGIIDDIADDLATCFVLKFLSLEREPNDVALIKDYCDKPLVKLDELIKVNAALFVPQAASSTLMQSNTVGKKRQFSSPPADDGSDDDDTMSGW